MKLKKYIEEKRKQRRDFLVGAGTLIALPFLESLYCKNLYAQQTAPLRVLFGMIWPGVDQVGNGYAHQSTLDVLKDIMGDTVFHRGIKTHAAGGRHPDFCQKFGYSDGRNSFNFHAAKITGNGSKEGPLNVGFDHEAGFEGYRFLKEEGGNSHMYNDFSVIAREALSVNHSGVVTDPNTNQPIVVQLDKPTRLKKLSLDYVVDSIKDLQRKLSPSDKFILDKHLSEIRNIETSLPRDPASEPTNETPPDSPKLSACNGPRTVGSEKFDWLKRHDLMVDILSQSFICDSRRVISVISNNCREVIDYHNWPDRFPNYTRLIEIIRDKSNKIKDRAGAENDTRPDYHLTTHFIQGGEKGNVELAAALSREPGGADNFLREVRKDIDRYNVDFYRRIALKLKGTQDVNNKSVLDNSLIYFGGHMGDATQHSPNNLFTCTIGKARGAIDTSQNFNNHDTYTGNFQSSLIDKLKNS